VDAPGRSGSRFNGGTIVAAGLRAAGITHVDALAITHAQSDHMGGMMRLMDQMNHVKQLWLADVPDMKRHRGIQRLIQRVQAQGGSVRWLKRGEDFVLGDGKGQVLWPPAGYAPPNPNNGSLVFSFQLENGARILFPGDIEGELVPNPNVMWSDIDASLPAQKIEVLGPPPTSGTRDAFVELAMEGGCQTIPWVKALKSKDKSRYKAICQTIREDGAYVEAGENDNLIVQKLQANPVAFGIFGFSFLDQNVEKVKGAAIDGVVPTFEAIADASYPVSRPLFFYVKKAHVDVIPGLDGFLREFTSNKAWGDEGYLADRGLIPMSVEERENVAATVRTLTPISLTDLDSQ